MKTSTVNTPKVSVIKTQNIPSGEKKPPKSSRAFARTLPGISQPCGYFDPLGFSKDTTIGEIKRFREVEITHGRVSMLAAVGYLVGELDSVENNPLWDGKITGPALTHFQQVEELPYPFWELLVLFIGIAECYRVAYAYRPPELSGDQLKYEYIPGELGFDPLELYPVEKRAQKVMKTAELNNGRLAMFGISGMIAQEEVDHQKIFEHLTGIF